MFSTPILFLVFNRPDLTSKVFDRIREIKPQFLYVAADGPRSEIPEDAIKCESVREIIKKGIDWNCEVQTLFRERNLGCKKAVSSAIDWFFEHVEEGIILEDDCLPDHTFFRFCELLLQKFRDDQRVMQITGVNVSVSWHQEHFDYFYSRFGGIWGWATWRRAWSKYDVNLEQWKDLKIRRLLKQYFDDENFMHRSRLYDRLITGDIDTWDYQWTFAKLLNNGLSVVPSINLVSNIGFGPDASHTKGSSPWSELETGSIKFPLEDNDIYIPDQDYDQNFMTKKDRTNAAKVGNTWEKRIFSKIRFSLAKHAKISRR